MRVHVIAPELRRADLPLFRQAPIGNPLGDLVPEVAGEVEAFLKRDVALVAVGAMVGGIIYACVRALAL